MSKDKHLRVNNRRRRPRIKINEGFKNYQRLRDDSTTLVEELANQVLRSRSA